LIQHGAGLRATVRRLGEVVPLEVTEVPSGTQVFDWTVPDEWSLDEAFIENERGQRVVDLRDSNLHVVGYSVPVDVTLSLAELRPHLHTLPEYPDWVPYRTSYYTPSWGFCLADRVLKAMPDGLYRAVIRSRLAPGSMTLAEHLHRGASDEEILIFAHDCHPSLANDNLSGLAVAVHLAAYLHRRPTRYSYRFVFAPATIGSIAWLAMNEACLACIRHGLVLSLLGGEGPFHYKVSRSGKRPIDRAAWHVLRTEFPAGRRLDFLPWGYDERQFCSPGFNLPVGAHTRSGLDR
jgi:aminopeptidase-like protein